ncbi:hypothetical protein QIS99_24740 [Streptomyces sp. B-S-A8]|uniref:Uncharacterized protein n=1 Tax=Streptomyces solicavernae TaxID=3043614 RepID=A0ABT6S079_9ACTN|nr:hypothetical protein [Streptomyces sp. B-S-A8]MDI3389378.1 hypothetical protein [Streptomyces sp. B-S-A8]
MRAERREDRVRRLLDGPHPAVPPELGIEAMRRGARRGRRRARARRLLWLVLSVAFLAFAVWAGVEQPWNPPPAETTPPLDGW